MTEAAIIFHMHREMEINSLQREKHETGSTSLLWCYSQLLHGGFNNTNVLRYISGDRNPKSVSLGLNLGVGWAIPRALWGERILCFFSFEMCIPWPVAPSSIFKASSTASFSISLWLRPLIPPSYLLLWFSCFFPLSRPLWSHWTHLGIQETLPGSRALP